MTTETHVVGRGQRAYWDAASAYKTFNHPVDLAWLGDLAPSGSILDFGCGYGRLGEVLRDAGWANSHGVDFSPEMIALARQRLPDLAFTCVAALPLPFADATFDAAMLVAVLSCLIDDDVRRETMAEIARVLKPGGLVYMSDFALQTDAKSRARYQRFEETYGRYGIFESQDGGLFRHATEQDILSLLPGWEVMARDAGAITTNHGNEMITQRHLLRAPS